MNTNVVCNCCKHNNIIGKGNLLQEKFYIDCKKINVMYFKCLECKRINVVQIDDEETTRIKDSLIKVILQAIDIKRNSGKVGNKLNSKRIRLTESLDKRRENLLEKYKKEAEKVLTEN